MSKKPRKVTVKVEIDYDRLAAAIRDAITPRVVEVNRGANAAAAAKAAIAEWEWRKP